MKRTIQVLAVIFAIGATAQTLRAYTYETGIFFVEDEERKMSLLIELRKELSEKRETFNGRETQASAEFPHIANPEQLNEAVARQALRYIRAIGAEDALVKIIGQSEVKALRERMEPGI